MAWQKLSEVASADVASRQDDFFKAAKSAGAIASDETKAKDFDEVQVNTKDRTFRLVGTSGATKPVKLEEVKGGLGGLIRSFFAQFEDQDAVAAKREAQAKLAREAEEEAESKAFAQMRAQELFQETVRAVGMAKKMHDGNGPIRASRQTEMKSAAKRAIEALNTRLNKMSPEERKAFLKSVEDQPGFRTLVSRRQNPFGKVSGYMRDHFFRTMDRGEEDADEDDDASKAEKRELSRAAREASEATGKAFEASVSSWDDLEALDGIGPTGVARLKAAGITIQGLKTGQHTKAQLMGIKYISHAKVQALERAGFVIPGSEKEAPKKTHTNRVKASDPFSVEANRGLFSRKRSIRSGGALQHGTHVRGKLPMWWEEHVTDPLRRAREWVVGPLRPSESRVAYKEAKREARRRRALKLKQRVANSKSPFAANAWVALYELGTSAWFLWGLMAVLAVMLFPFGFAQYLAYFLYGLLTFAFNAGYVLAIQGMGLVTGLIVQGINAVGLLATGGVQRLLDYGAVALAGGAGASNASLEFYGSRMMLQNPFQLQNVGIYNTQLLDPAFFNPQQFSANSLGSVASDWVGNLLALGAGLWESSRATFASNCSAAGNPWYQCAPQYLLQAPWNGILNVLDFLTTSGADFMHNFADLWRTGNRRFLSNPLFEGFTEVITGSKIGGE